ncbi:MAG: uracil-DNA glycosylase family protein [bacterium]
MKNTNVIWVGLSAKKANDAENLAPLHIDTNTGKLVAEIEAQCRHINFYKTNLVKFPPLDSKGKLRYPTLKECALCYPELQVELQLVNPRVVLLLGNKTATFVFHQLGFQMPKLSYTYQSFEYEKRWYVPIHHPSYIMVYKRKEKDRYIKAVKTVIEQLAKRA